MISHGLGENPVSFGLGPYITVDTVPGPFVPPPTSGTKPDEPLPAPPQGPRVPPYVPEVGRLFTTPEALVGELEGLFTGLLKTHPEMLTFAALDQDHFILEASLGPNLWFNLVATAVGIDLEADVVEHLDFLDVVLRTKDLGAELGVRDMMATVEPIELEPSILA